MEKYFIQDREAGNIIDEYATLAEAHAALDAFEAEDEKNWTYTPEFYEIKGVRESYVVIKDDHVMTATRAYHRYDSIPDALNDDDAFFNHDGDRFQQKVAEFDTLDEAKKYATEKALTLKRGTEHGVFTTLRIEWLEIEHVKYDLDEYGDVVDEECESMGVFFPPKVEKAEEDAE